MLINIKRQRFGLRQGAQQILSGMLNEMLDEMLKQVQHDHQHHVNAELVSASKKSLNNALNPYKTININT